VPAKQKEEISKRAYGRKRWGARGSAPDSRDRRLGEGCSKERGASLCMARKKEKLVSAGSINPFRGAKYSKGSTQGEGRIGEAQGEWGVRPSKVYEGGGDPEFAAPRHRESTG